MLQSKEPRFVKCTIIIFAVIGSSMCYPKVISLNGPITFCLFNYLNTESHMLMETRLNLNRILNYILRTELKKLTILRKVIPKLSSGSNPFPNSDASLFLAEDPPPTLSNPTPC